MPVRSSTAGQPDRGGRSRFALWGPRSRRCALRCIYRRVRGHRATRRRRALAGQGRHARRGKRGRRDRRCGGRDGRCRPEGPRRSADRARRDSQQVAPGCQRDPWCLARGRSRPGCRGGAAAMALSRRRDRPRVARADDERAQRWRPRRQQGGLPGVHDRPLRCLQLLGMPTHRLGGVSLAQAHVARARHVHRRR